MTPDQLRAWQAQMGYTYDTAAVALGMSRSGYAKMVLGHGRPQFGFYALGITRSCTRRKDAMDPLSIDHDADVLAALFVVPN